MQQFLGLANYFQKGTPDYSRTAAPLHDLVKKNINFSELVKDPAYLFAFNRIKHLMAEHPCLALADPTQPYQLISDASMTGCGAILVQNNRPVAYFSSKYTPAERNYTTGEQELLGVVKALREWRCYLEGCVGLTVITDHKPLTYFPTQMILSRRQSRWLDFLSRFNFLWKHTPGVNNPADGLSRLHSAAIYLCTARAISRLHSATTLSDLETRWLQSLHTYSHSLDALHGTLHRACALNTIMELNHTFVSLFPDAYSKDPRFLSPKFTEKMTQVDGFWYYKDNRIVVPSSLEHPVTLAHHSTAFSGHFGTRRTAVKHVCRSFYWPGMHSFIKTFCQSCPSCQTSKSSTQHPYGLLQPLSIPDERWDVVCLDWITGLPRTPHGFDSILVFIDKLTKMVHLAPCKKTITAKQTAQLFLQHVWSKHGSPLRLVSDRDKIFTSTYWSEFCAHLGTKVNMSTAYHPQSDAQTERSNRTIEEVLRHFCPSVAAWDDLLPFVEFAMNNAKNASTGKTPFMLNTGKHPRSPISNQLPRPPGSHALPSISDIFQTRDEVLLRIRRLLQSAQDRQKSYADRNRRSHTFAAGQQVLLSTIHFRFQGKGKQKLYPKFVGPFLISHMVGPNAAELQLPSDFSIHNVFHVSLLRPFVSQGADLSLSQIPPAAPDGTPSATVATILAHRDIRHCRGRPTVREYLIRWHGLSPEHDSWELPSKLHPLQIEAYLRSALGQ